MTRIEPIPVKQWPQEMRAALAAMAPPVPTHPQPVQKERPKALNTLGTFAHHPAAAQAFLTFNGHVLMATTLTERQRELLVLRVATLRGSNYEWAQHVFVGHDVGLDDEDIARIALGPDAPFWDELDAALLRAADELIADGAICASTWEVLVGHLDTRQILDVIFTVGAYETLAFVLRSFEVPLDDDIAALRAKNKAR